MHQGNSHVIGSTIDVGVRHNVFDEIVSLKNLLLAWREFRCGKRGKYDVQLFECNLEDNLFKLHQELANKTYVNNAYVSFFITDPKLRHIHKASVRDRVVHQAVFRVLYPVFDRGFIFDSYSCRIDKGTHRAVTRFERFLGKASQNLHEPVYALKCDIRKFFDTVDHGVLLGLVRKKSHDLNTLWLIKQIVDSFETQPGKGLPLGNVTSQLFSNIYLNELDQFVKHKLKVRYYLRYCDDFVVVANNQQYLEGIIPLIAEFLEQELKLELHDRKIIIKKYNQGIDFLGYVSLPHYSVLRTKTKHRIFKKLARRRCEFEEGVVNELSFRQSLQSYLGVLQHCSGFKIGQQLMARFNI